MKYSLQRCLDIAVKWGFTSVKNDIRDLFELTDCIFIKILSCNAKHCFNSLLPAKTDLCDLAMCSRGHNFQLLQIVTTLFKNMFINRYLFNSPRIELGLAQLVDVVNFTLLTVVCFNFLIILFSQLYVIVAVTVQ
jgi:hypothetical protein